MKAALSDRAWCIRLLFIILVPCLFLQFKLSDITEPYPAILLPSAGPFLESRGSFNAYQTKLVAEDSSGGEHPFLAATILDKVPSNYHGHVIARGFGINMDRDVRRPSVPFSGGGLRVQFGRPLTAGQIEETRVWLRRKVRKNLGVDPARIHILTYEIKTFYDRAPARQETSLHGRATIELN